MSIVLNKETIFTDELIRENARLTVQHEADRMELDACKERLAELELYAKEADEAGAMCDAVRKEACMMKEELDATNAKLAKAVADLHFVMAGGDPCKVCTVKCSFGEGNCKPVWRGEEAGQ